MTAETDKTKTMMADLKIAQKERVKMGARLLSTKPRKGVSQSCSICQAANRTGPCPGHVSHGRGNSIGELSNDNVHTPELTALNIKATQDRLQRDESTKDPHPELTSDEEETLVDMFRLNLIMLKENAAKGTLSISLKPGNIKNPVLTDEQQKAYSAWFAAIKKTAEEFKIKHGIRDQSNSKFMRLERNSLGLALILRFPSLGLYDQFITQLKAKHLLPSTFHSTLSSGTHAAENAPTALSTHGSQNHAKNNTEDKKEKMHQAKKPFHPTPLSTKLVRTLME